MAKPERLRRKFPCRDNKRLGNEAPILKLNFNTTPACRFALSLLLLVIFLGTTATTVDAQNIRSLKHEISSLCSPAWDGRGYVRKGREHAAAHIMRKLRDAGLKPVTPDSSFYQYYTFPVVSFPDSMNFQAGKRELVPGEEYLVDAASSSYYAHRRKVQTVDVGRLEDSTEAIRVLSRLHDNRVHLLRGTDSLARLLHIRSSQLVRVLPPGAYIIPVNGKMNWTVATEQLPVTVIYAQDSALPKHVRKTSIEVHSKFEPAARSANVIAMVRGTEVPDSFLVITAHYDHLGRMGWDALFPGASDNASGTACLEWLAAYYAEHPQRYSILFIAFSGEEAGLKGSSFFVKHPLVPLSQMRFVINLDIMGNASDGVTVVNATENPAAFGLLQSLNKKKGYLPEIRSRGRAANSDHYPFSEAGVPAFFLYSNGGPGYYHDVFDRPANIALTNVDKVLQLLMDFIGAMQ